MSSKTQTTTKAVRHRHTRGQALVEFALMGLLLGMLLAAAVDLGRAYYTSVIVANMAGEGAAYAALNPDRDLNYHFAGTCSQFTVQQFQNIQDRAKKVANDRGLIISDSRASVQILDNNGNPSLCSTRTAGSAITVKVTYTINDLFLPGLLGMNSITINKSATQRLMRSADCIAAGTCTN